MKHLNKYIIKKKRKIKSNIVKKNIKVSLEMENIYESAQFTLEI